MKLSGPLKKVRIPACESSGTRAAAFSSSGATCSQSSGSVMNSLSAGIPSIPQGLAFGSKNPTSSLPASSL